MKNLLLLLAALSTGLSAIAQQNSNVMTLPSARIEGNLTDFKVTGTLENTRHFTRNATSNKTTTLWPTIYNEWFYYWDQNATSSSTLYYNVVAADSNILDSTSSGTPYHVFCHGLGMSFDPTDEYYYAYAATNPITASPITETIGYDVDSFFARMKYYRNDNTTTAADSLIVEFVVTTSDAAGAPDSGIYKIRFNPSASFLPITSDSTPRFSSPIYTRENSIYGPNEVYDTIIATKQRYAFPLVLADTTGSKNVYFGLSSALHVPPKGKVVSFVHFKSAFTTTLGTSTTANSNFIRLYSGTTANIPTAWPQQPPHTSSYAGSYQTGLIAQNQNRYEDTGYTYNGHNMLMPGVAFSTPHWAVTDQAFHVHWLVYEDDPNIFVDNINKAISSVRAFPNPASTSLNITFNLANIADATVTLTNMVGQVVATQTISNTVSGNATFNVAALPGGVYCYSIVANGERSTGKVTIVH